MIWFLLHLLLPNSMKWSYLNVCAGGSGSTRMAQKKREMSKRKGICHILTTGAQRKTSNHSSARELEPVQKDWGLFLVNCRWWLLASHAWQCTCLPLLAARAHCCQLSLQVMNMVLGPCKGGVRATDGGGMSCRNPSWTQSGLYADNPQLDGEL